MTIHKETVKVLRVHEQLAEGKVGGCVYQLNYRRSSGELFWVCPGVTYVVLLKELTGCVVDEWMENRKKIISRFKKKKKKGTVV